MANDIARKSQLHGSPIMFTQHHSKAYIVQSKYLMGVTWTQHRRPILYKKV